MIVTRAPARASRYAAHAPAGPAPTIPISALISPNPLNPEPLEPLNLSPDPPMTLPNRAQQIGLMILLAALAALAFVRALSVP